MPLKNIILKISGFTLAECLMVLCVSMILLVMVIPSQQIFFHKTQSDLLRAQLFQAIHLARVEAMSRGEWVTLCKSEHGDTCEGVWQKGFIVLAGKEVIFSYHAIPNDGILRWRAFPKHREDLQFSPLGATDAENGTFSYCMKNKQYWSIVINQSGRARIVLPASPVKCEF